MGVHERRAHTRADGTKVRATTVRTGSRTGAGAVDDSQRDRLAAQAAFNLDQDFGHEPEYLGHHQPAQGPPVWDLVRDGTGDGDMPPDVYDHPDWYTGYTEAAILDETVAALRACRGNPDAMVTIYRGAPPDASGFDTGNWVSLSKRYAQQHGYDATNPDDDWPVLETQVPASTVLFAGDDLCEFGYWGPPVDTGPGTRDPAGSVDDLMDRHRHLVTFVSERNQKINVSKVVVPDGQRGQGHGSRFMTDVCDYADRTEQTVTLTPSADFGGNKARLVEFYRRFGFVENKGRNKDYEITETMYRPPNLA